MVTQKKKETKEMIEFIMGVVIGWCVCVIHNHIKELTANEEREQEKDNE